MALSSSQVRSLHNAWRNGNSSQFNQLAQQYGVNTDYARYNTWASGRGQGRRGGDDAGEATGTMPTTVDAAAFLRSLSEGSGGGGQADAGGGSSGGGGRGGPVGSGGPAGNTSGPGSSQNEGPNRNMITLDDASGMDLLMQNIIPVVGEDTANMIANLPPDMRDQILQEITQEEVQNRLSEERRIEEERLRSEAAATAEAEAEAQRVADQERFQEQLSTAQTGAQDRIIADLLRDYGIQDATPYQSYIDDVIGDITRGIGPDEFSDPTPLFSGDLTSGIVDDALRTQRRNTTNQFNQLYSPGFETNFFADTADDAIINSILDRDYQDALTQLDNNLATGRLNQGGYERALEDLGNQRIASESNLQNIGGGLLQGFRDEAISRVGTGLQNIGNSVLGTPFDVGGFTSELEGYRDTSLAGLEGDILSSLSGPTIDFASAFAAGGAGQGATNPGNQPGGLAAAMAERRKQEESERGLGSTGAF